MELSKTLTASSGGRSSPEPVLPRQFLRPCVLLLLRERPAHGYELLRRLVALGFGEPDPGGLYHLLRKLEAEGLVRSAWERSTTAADRRTYQLTRSGMERLHQHVKALAAGRTTLAAFLARYEEFVALGVGRTAREPSPDAAQRAASDGGRG